MSDYAARFTQFSADYFRDPASIPQLPITFPRNEWLEDEHFGAPPFGPHAHAHEVAWAARQASRCWLRCLGEPIDDGHQYDRAPQPEIEDVVDETCFKLALFDKILEALWYCRQEQQNSIVQFVFTWDEYLEEIDELSDLAYAQAVPRIPPGSPPAPPLNDLRAFLRAALMCWSQIVAVHDRPPPFRLVTEDGALADPKDWVEPFSIAELGRFAAKYYTFTSLEFWLEGDHDERVATKEVVEPAEPVPRELRPSVAKRLGPTSARTRGDARSAPTPARSPLSACPSAVNVQLSVDRMPAWGRKGSGHTASPQRAQRVSGAA